MAVKVLYFAGLREAIGSGGESVATPAEVTTVAALRDWLATRGEGREALISAKNLRAAVNQKMAGLDTAVADGDEVAFFPPVTGG
jgi:molybdopterin synthase sulfur carrier subunit